VHILGRVYASCANIISVLESELFFQLYKLFNHSHARLF
jgi:hypothetical protein